MNNRIKKFDENSLGPRDESKDSQINIPEPFVGIFHLCPKCNSFLLEHLPPPEIKMVPFIIYQCINDYHVMSREFINQRQLNELKAFRKLP